MTNLLNRNLVKFARRYLLFTIALLASILGLIFDISGMHTVAHWILGVTALIIALPLIRGMWHDFTTGSYGIDILAITAIVSAVLLHQYWAAMIIVLMLTGGEALEDYAEHRSKTELDALLSRAPQQAHVIRGKRTVDIPVSQIQIGDRIIIRPGETVPVDAAILEGSSNFDESSLTGESMPETKNTGESLLSGSVNIDGVITARATQIAAHSQYQQIIKLVKSAAASQAPFVRMADRYSVPFTLFAFALAGTVWVISGDANRFLEVIVVATPCPLILAAPIAIISGMSRAAKQGIIIRTGSALERLASVRTIAFDKTGTLTQGKPVVADIITYGKHTKNDVLAHAAAIEASSLHVLASAITTAANNKKLKISKARHIRETAGNGLSAVVGGKKVLIGRLSLLDKYEVILPKGFTPTGLKQTVTYVAINDELAGAITFTDDIRPESASTLDRLKRFGINSFVMITGDNKATAARVAKKLGIGDVVAEVLPAGKLHAIEAIKVKPVAFVGDGVNDAPVLTAADVGIALGARGSSAASESADLIIMQDSVAQVADSVEIAHRTFKIARQSILVGIGLSVLLMIIFATGKFTAIYGAIIQELVDVVVIFNALRAHNGGRQS
jgi:heavy metal translocating P-type ATPase